MYLLCICPSLHDYIRSRFHKKQTATVQATKVIPDLPATLSNCASSRQKHENKLTIKVSCFVSSLIKQISTSYTVQAVSNDSIHAPFKRIHNCNSNHECYLMHLRNQNQHSQTGGVYLSLFSLSPLSTNNLNTKFTVSSVPYITHSFGKVRISRSNMPSPYAKQIEIHIECKTSK